MVGPLVIQRLTQVSFLAHECFHRLKAITFEVSPFSDWILLGPVYGTTVCQ